MIYLDLILLCKLGIRSTSHLMECPPFLCLSGFRYVYYYLERRETLVIINEDCLYPNKSYKGEGDYQMKTTNSTISDRLHTLANEYSTTPETLANIAVQRLLNDVELFRNLRAGKEVTLPPNEQT